MLLDNCCSLVWLNLYTFAEHKQTFLSGSKFSFRLLLFTLQKNFHKLRLLHGIQLHMARLSSSSYSRKCLGPFYLYFCWIPLKILRWLSEVWTFPQQFILIAFSMSVINRTRRCASGQVMANPSFHFGTSLGQPVTICYPHLFSPKRQLSINFYPTCIPQPLKRSHRKGCKSHQLSFALNHLPNKKARAGQLFIGSLRMQSTDSSIRCVLKIELKLDKSAFKQVLFENVNFRFITYFYAQ